MITTISLRVLYKSVLTFFITILILDPVVSQWTHAHSRSSTSAMLFGVQEGMVHGPLLHILYTAPLFDIIVQHRVNAHQYTDDLRLHICVWPAEASIATDCLDACLVDVEGWLKASRLRLNSDLARAKLRLWGLDLRSTRSKCGLMMFHCCHVKSGTPSNLGIVVASQLSMSANVAVVCRGGYYQLRKLRPLKRCMTDEAIKTLTHSIIILDYCNVLY